MSQLSEPSPHRLRGRRALVTGGSKGIGLAVAQRLAAEGARVVAVARSMPSLSPADGIEFVVGDISTDDGTRAVASAATDSLGSVDILVDNAGRGQPYLPDSAAIPDEAWVDSLAVNLLAAVRLDRYLVPPMRRAGRGAIIHITTTGAHYPGGPLSHYHAAKAGLLNYSKGLAGETAGNGVRVNAVTPGIVETPGIQALYRDLGEAAGSDPAAMRTMVETEWGPAIGRNGDPAEIAALVAFLVSDDAAYITGAEIVIDGGQLKEL